MLRSGAYKGATGAYLSTVSEPHPHCWRAGSSRAASEIDADGRERSRYWQTTKRGICRCVGTCDFQKSLKRKSLLLVSTGRIY